MVAAPHRLLVALGVLGVCWGTAGGEEAHAATQPTEEQVCKTTVPLLTS